MNEQLVQTHLMKYRALLQRSKVYTVYSRRAAKQGAGLTQEQRDAARREAVKRFHQERVAS